MSVPPFVRRLAGATATLCTAVTLVIAAAPAASAQQTYAPSTGAHGDPLHWPSPLPPHLGPDCWFCVG